jgi:hypothetical protein
LAACDGFLELMKHSLCTREVDMSESEIWLNGERLLVALHGVTRALRSLQRVSQVYERIGGVRPLPGRRADQRYGFVEPPLLSPDQPQQVKRVEIAGLQLQDLAIDPFGFRETAVLLQ